MAIHILRREFIAALGGLWATWPLAARAQQRDRVRRIGVLMGWNESDPEAQSNLAAFVQELQQLGWMDGHNMRIDYRWSNGDVSRMQIFAKELAALTPDAILAHTTPVTAALQRETRSIPIVFVVVGDPVGEGFVAGLSHPGGNITGFLWAEGAFVGKMLELLTEIAPTVKRVAIMFNPNTAAGRGSYYLPSFETAARSFKLEAIAAPVRNDAEVEATIALLGREKGSGLVAMPDGFSLVHRAPIILHAAQNKIPAIYWHSIIARDGGLLSYGPDTGDMFRRAAPYIDRILRGAKPAELPVQLPTKFQMAVNLKTAKALGLTLSPSILLRADEVIE
jgi:putative tryptophan/tyrosine transport system substrate-binding protein